MRGHVSACSLAQGSLTIRNAPSIFNSSWVGLRAALDAVEKRKISYSAGNRISVPRHSSPSLYRLRYPGLNVKLSLCLIKHHTMKTYGEWRCSSSILDLGTRCKFVVSFTPRPLYPRCKSHATSWIGGGVGPRARLGAMDKRERRFTNKYW
jgi:hypothetical protein